MMSNFLFLFVVGTSTFIVKGTEITTSDSSTLSYILIGVMFFYGTCPVCSGGGDCLHCTLRIKEKV